MKKEDLEKEYNYLKICYSIHLNQNEKLLKSLVYLEWKMNCRIKYMEENLKNNRKQKENIKQKILVIEQIRNEIHNEIDKYIKEFNAKEFEYEGVEKIINSGFKGL